ncbi:MAG: hypothetical protein B7Y97_13140 [Sphingomonas sp. 32-66-10]|nr:MAG: hypothetical protein B7Y97_13140 [Sphingomonas sp. 32-66-10]
MFAIGMTALTLMASSPAFATGDTTVVYTLKPLPSEKCKLAKDTTVADPHLVICRPQSIGVQPPIGGGSTGPYNPVPNTRPVAIKQNGPVGCILRPENPIPCNATK